MNDNYELINQQKTLVLLGCGGHARSVANIAIENGFEHLIFYDENAKEGEYILGHPVYKNIPQDMLENYVYIPCAGDNLKREKQMEWLEFRKLKIVKIIAKTAHISKFANISEGCFVGHHAYIGPEVNIEKNCIINTGAIIEHEVKIDAHSHISIKAALAGRVNIGQSVMIGAGATIIDQKKICHHCVIGAGAVVINDLNQSGTYVGVPAFLKIKNI
jgi:UDP-N-acetylbacillosamine N-acetyltransferase